MGFFSRRGFLKAFGLTTAATLVEPTRMTQSLFGSSEAKAATSAMGYHLVLYRRPVRRPATGNSDIHLGGNEVLATYPVVGVVQNQFPEHRSWLLDESPLPDGPDRYNGLGQYHSEVAEIIVTSPPTEDPYIGFYKAAERIRRVFADQSLKRIQNVHKHICPKVQLVTVVHDPIYARPIGVRSGNPFRTGEGFEVACDCDSRIVMNPDLEGWEVYSQFGEIPIEVPSEIQMRVLLQYDLDIVTHSGKGWRRYKA